MEKTIFDECLKYYQQSDGHTKFWPMLADKFNYVSGEALRSEFKHERKRRGVPSRNDQLLNIPPVNGNRPRVGVVDIESLPAMVYTFQLYDQNIGIEQIISDVAMLSWAGKFLNESEMYSDIMTPAEAISRDTSRIAKSCWEFLSNCDVVIGHNFQNFDAKMINVAFLENGLNPLKYTIVDTLLVARQNFKFSSNKLAYINKKLGVREKISNEGFPLWKACSEGKQSALDTMLEYNIGDIYSTEQLFYKIRPYVRNFNVALYNEISSYQCPICGSEKVHNEGFYMTSAGKWESVRCDVCGSISRKKTNLLSVSKKKHLLINS